MSPLQLRMREICSLVVFQNKYLCQKFLPLMVEFDNNGCIKNKHTIVKVSEQKYRRPIALIFKYDIKLYLTRGHNRTQFAICT